MELTQNNLQAQSNGTNAVSLYFILTAIALWILTLSTQGFHLPHAQGINGYIFVLINAVFSLWVIWLGILVLSKATCPF